MLIVNVIHFNKTTILEIRDYKRYTIGLQRLQRTKLFTDVKRVYLSRNRKREKPYRYWKIIYVIYSIWQTHYDFWPNYCLAI